MLRLTPFEETRVGKELFKQGQISILSLLIEQQFQIPASMASASLRDLKVETLDELSQRFLDFKTAFELAAWIDAHETGD